jgi:hypothetical protein
VNGYRSRCIIRVEGLYVSPGLGRPECGRRQSGRDGRRAWLRATRGSVSGDTAAAAGTRFCYTGIDKQMHIPKEEAPTKGRNERKKCQAGGR